MNKPEYDKTVERIIHGFDLLKSYMQAGRIAAGAWETLSELRSLFHDVEEKADEVWAHDVEESKRFLKLPIQVVHKQDGGRDELTWTVVEKSEIITIARWRDHRNNIDEEFNGKATVMHLKNGTEYIVPLKPTEVLKLVWGVTLSDVPGTLRAERPEGDSE
jgi:hypothetical protein